MSNDQLVIARMGRVASHWELVIEYRLTSNDQRLDFLAYFCYNIKINKILLMGDPALKLEAAEVAKSDVFVTNEKKEQVQLFGAMAGDYLRIQENMKSGRFNPGDLDMMGKIMQFANMPAAWRKFPEPVKKEVTEVRERVAKVTNLPDENDPENKRKKFESIIDNAAQEAGMSRDNYNQLLFLYGAGLRGASGRFISGRSTNEASLKVAIDWIKKHDFKVKDDYFTVSDLDLSKLGHEIILPNLHVRGNLNLSNANISYLPKKLRTDGDLNLSGSDIQSIPESLYVGHDLDISNCHDLQQIGLDTHIGGDLTCYNCPSLFAFPAKRQRFSIKGKIIGDEIAYYIAQKLGFVLPDEESKFSKSISKGKPIGGYKFIYYKGQSKEENIMQQGISEGASKLSKPSKDYELIPKNLRK